MFCAPNRCSMSNRACLCNKRIALEAIKKIVDGKNVTRFEIDRVLAYRGCAKGNSALGKEAIQLMFDNWFGKEEL